jgi:hypothetical protein
MERGEAGRGIAQHGLIRDGVAAVPSGRKNTHSTAFPVRGSIALARAR